MITLKESRQRQVTERIGNALSIPQIAMQH